MPGFNKAANTFFQSIENLVSLSRSLENCVEAGGGGNMKGLVKDKAKAASALCNRRWNYSYRVACVCWLGGLPGACAEGMDN